LAAGVAQGSVIYSGPLNLQQTFTSSSYRQGVSFPGVSGTNDFTFGFEAAANKPYVDARTYVGTDVGGQSGLVSWLAKANAGLPLTPAGTMIDPSYAATYPAIAAGRAYFTVDGSSGNTTGDWSATAVNEGFVGMELTLSGGTSYGWLHFIDNPTAASPTLTLVDYAYESTPGVGIETVIVPEPSALALGSVGMVALLALRKRK
jgi:hypothetical protein